MTSSLERHYGIQDFLRGRRIWISTSTNDEMSSVERRCLEILVLEICRFIFAAEGTVAYGGDLRAGGMTYLFYEAALRHFPESEARQSALLHALSEAQYSTYSRKALMELKRRLQPIGELLLIDASGNSVGIDEASLRPIQKDRQQAALTSMRTHLAKRIDAQVVFGGGVPQSGQVPGLWEEFHLAQSFRKPSIILGGFGGVAKSMAAEVGASPLQNDPRKIHSISTPYMNEAIGLLLKNLRQYFGN